MFTRKFIPALLLASLAGSASAVTFVAGTSTEFLFTLPAGVTLNATTSQATNSVVTDSGTATPTVTFGGNGTDDFTLVTSAIGDAPSKGTTSATATGSYLFVLTNTSKTQKATVNLHFTYGQLAALLGSTSTDDYASSSIASNGLDTFGFSNISADNGSPLSTFSDELDFSIVLNKKATKSFGFVSTSEGYAINAVPEPASFAALGLGAAAMLRRRRK